MDAVIQVEQVSKQYRLGKVGTGTLAHDLNRWWHQVRGKEDPYLKIGEANDRTVSGNTDYVWALRDINFEIEQGQAVGIIGRNGAGKSTLLKILSRTTAPTTGKVRMKGRVASLLEVGTGFHPELSGRENIYLNGAILGMTKREIGKKFEEIVAFAGVERYVDTPVKRYSSGMYVRLAFAVAAHLESEILIVDEVLAVGDAEFQKKCLGKMGDISREKGKTILFVSHNLQAIRNLCESSMLMSMGRIDEFTSTSAVIEKYMRSNTVVLSETYSNYNSDKAVFLQEAFLSNDNELRSGMFSSDENITVNLIIIKKTPLRGIYLHFTLVNNEGILIFETDTIEQETNAIDSSRIGTLISRINIPKRILNTGRYYISLGIASSQAEKFQIESLSNFMAFEVTADLTARDRTRKAITSTILKWESQFID